MHVIVLGSGVVGTATAYFLAQNGATVTVLDRQAGPALETSFGNAGEISPTLSSPWAGPGVPQKAFKWLADPYGPLRLYPQLDYYQWRWMAQMLLNCNKQAYERNKSRMLRLALYSRDQFVSLREQGIGIDYDGRQKGTLQLFRTDAELAGVVKDTEVLARLNLPYRILDRQGVIEVEPGLAAVAEKVAGGLLLPMDETGDCFKFTNGLAERAKAAGVEFRFGVDLKQIIADGTRVAGIETGQGRVTGDAYVVALGSYSPLMTRPIGIDLPVYPVKGYSLTMPVIDDAMAPQSTMLDERYKVAITRLGDRIRVAGTAELSGYNQVLRPGRLATIRHCVGDLFPKGGDFEQIEYWTGLRPMTPDGTPIVGPTRYPNLWLNTGHGTLGWTMSLGSGRLVADWVSGRTPEIDTDGLTFARFGR